nr:putative ubiquinone biosynthesis protein UbiB [Oceanusvirus sp.]
MLHVGRIALCAGEVLAAHSISPSMGAKLAAHRAQDLGPSFVKMGQFASTRADVLSEHYCREFAKLRDDTRRDSAADIRNAVVKSLGIESIESVFSEFDDEPIASASVAQVHRARLAKNDQVVAVKVLKKGIREAVEADLAVAHTVASMLPKDAAVDQFNRMLSQYSDLLRRETDFVSEARSGLSAKRTLARALGNEVIVPKPLISREGVIVMEHVPSVPLKESRDLPRVTGLVMEAIMVLITSGEWFHQDPHEGNLGIVRDSRGNERLVIYDFGNVSRLAPDTLDGLMETTVAFLQKDKKAIAKSLIDNDLVQAKDSGLIALDTMIDQGLEYVRTMNIQSFDASSIDRESAHSLDVSPEINNVMRAVIMAEGVCKSVHKDFELEASIDQFIAVHGVDIVSRKASRDVENVLRSFGLFD